MKLEGLRVVDLSLFLPGPHLTQMMCDHGAEVIGVEPPEGEPARGLGPTQNGHTPWFRNTHRGKKSLCLNLKLPAAREALLRLCDTADVFVEAFRPGVVQRLGIDYATLSARNPRLVYCSITAFGQTGPYRDRPAHDLSIEALAGLVSVNLGADGRPALPGVPAADLCASLMAFGGILMSLVRRASTGTGDYLDISMQDALLAWTQNLLGPVFAEGRAHDVQNERGWGGRGFYNVYETADGRFLTLSGNEPKFVHNLLTALGRPDFKAVAQSEPGAHQAELTGWLRATFAGRTLAEWTDWFRDKDVCWGSVLNLHEAFHDAQAAARDMLVKDADGSLHVGIPIKFAREPGRIRPEVSALNADAEAVLGPLGYTAAEIKALAGNPV